MLSHSGPMREERQRIYGCNSNLSNLFSDAIAHEPGTSWDGTPSDRTSRRSRTRGSPEKMLWGRPNEVGKGRLGTSLP
ncbi:hypothetical protein X777_02263, partial [Ooceraea biroi]